MPKLLQRPGAHLIQTIPKLSQDDVTLSMGKFVAGEVLGEIDGTYTKLDATAEATEANVAVAVCSNYYDATDADVQGLAVTRLAAVDAGKLTWPEAATEQQKADWTAELATRHIIAR